MFQLAQDPHFPHGRNWKTFPIAVFLLDALEGHELAVSRPSGLVNLMSFDIITHGSCQVGVGAASTPTLQPDLTSGYVLLQAATATLASRVFPPT